MYVMEYVNDVWCVLDVCGRVYNVCDGTCFGGVCVVSVGYVIECVWGVCGGM